MKLTSNILKKIIQEQLTEIWKDDEEGYAKRIARAKPETSDTEATRGADDIDMSAPADMSADDIDLKSVNESRYYIKVKLS